MQSHSRFIAVDPSKTHKKDQKARQLQCQTCFNSFDTHQQLRDHIADFQLELQQLAARLLEAQAHLPRKHHSRNHERCKCHKEPTSDLPDNDYKVDDGDSDLDTEGDNDDDGDFGNDGNETEDRSDDDSGDHGEDKTSHRTTFYSTLDVHASMQCPYPTCRRKAHFMTRAGLERHYESHVRCHEVCVFCRQSFKQIRKFIRHTCRARQKANDEAKEFYRKERCAQLKRYSAKKLGRAIPSGEARNGQTNKRKAELADGCPAMNASKLRKGNPTQGIDTVFMTSGNFYGFPPPRHVENPIQTSLFPSSNSNEAANSLTNLSNMAFPSKMLSHAQMEPAYDTLVPQPYAPIFDDITITPCYDLVQESYAFSSTLQNANYPAIPQHEADGVLPTSDKRVLD